MHQTRAVYTTQGGGVCRYINGVYIWVKPPTDTGFSDMKVGDQIPEEWGITALNDAANQEAEGNRENG